MGHDIDHELDEADWKGFVPVVQAKVAKPNPLLANVHDFSFQSGRTQ